MEIFTRANSSTECRMAMENMAGLMGVHLKATSDRGCVTAMGCGKQAMAPSNCIRDTMTWTRRVDMVYIPGRVAGVIEETFRVTIEAVMVSSTTVRAN